MPQDFEATITNPERRRDWLAWIGQDTVKIRSFLPSHYIICDVPCHVYILDEKCLTSSQRSSLCQGIAEKFHVTVEEVETSIDREGIPIVASDVTVTVYNPFRWMID